MKGEFCAVCGSTNLRQKVREMEFKIPNPGKVAVRQRCKECQECGERYFDDRQIAELSKKIKNATKAAKK
jgi:YgiT-type zinc finger domain-containing protein